MEVFRPVIASGAYGFALMHNHPGGDCSPSRADEVVTRRMVEAANVNASCGCHITVGVESIIGTNDPQAMSEFAR